VQAGNGPASLVSGDDQADMGRGLGGLQAHNLVWAKTASGGGAAGSSGPRGPTAAWEGAWDFDYRRAMVGGVDVALTMTVDKLEEFDLDEQQYSLDHLLGWLEGSRVLGSGVVSWRAEQADRVIGKALEWLASDPLDELNVELLVTEAFPHVGE